jgi:gliding motility-associated-like protein
LYENETDTAALRESNEGLFQIEATASKTYYVGLKNAGCQSTRTPVKVIVSSADIKFSNLVSPNGDGINDTWQIANIESYSLAFVQIFNRLGTVVFKQMGYSRPFDGTSNGKDLPAGTYYYVVELSKECKPITGSLTVVK